MVDSAFELLNLHINVSYETFDKLCLYYDLLIKWQNKINLISSDTIDHIWERHFLDSAQLINYLPEPNGNIIDIGSGAGFPGMILAVMGIPNIHLIESDGKKISFLREVARITNSNVTIHHDRVEDINIENCKIILSRAVTDLTQLLNLIEKNVSHETISLFHKGKNYSNELEEAKNNWSFEHQIFPSITGHNGVIIKLSHIKRRPR